MESFRAGEVTNPLNLDDDTAYAAWRSDKLSDDSALSEALNPVEISDISTPSIAEKKELLRRFKCRNLRHALTIGRF